MRSPGLFWISVVLLIVGLLGVSWLSVAIPPVRSDVGRFRGDLRSPDLNLDGGSEGAASQDLGERIFRTGEGEDGPIPRTAVGPGMMGGGCADCHGRDGKGRTISFMMGNLETPDIRLSTLMRPHGDGEEAWTREDIGRAIRDGIEPDGRRLDTFMPRWRMSDSEQEALLDYMEELNGS